MIPVIGEKWEKRWEFEDIQRLFNLAEAEDMKILSCVDFKIRLFTAVVWWAAERKGVNQELCVPVSKVGDIVVKWPQMRNF